MHVTSYTFVPIIFFITLQLFLILYAVYLICKKHELINISENYNIQIIKNIQNILFNKPFEKLRDLIAPHIPYLGHFFLLIGQFIDNYGFAILKIPIIIFYVIPRIIVASTFL